jgi:hypothetical protein
LKNIVAPDHAAVVVVDVGERVAHGAARLAEAHFGAVGQVAGLERLLQHAASLRDTSCSTSE